MYFVTFQWIQPAKLLSSFENATIRYVWYFGKPVSFCLFKMGWGHWGMKEEIQLSVSGIVYLQYCTCVSLQPTCNKLSSFSSLLICGSTIPNVFFSSFFQFVSVYTCRIDYYTALTLLCPLGSCTIHINCLSCEICIIVGTFITCAFVISPISDLWVMMWWMSYCIIFI